MYLAQAIEYSVQTGRALSILFEWLFPLTRFIAFESGIDCRIIGIIAGAMALMFVTTWSVVGIFSIRSARIP